MYSLCLLAIQKYLSLARCKFQGTANVSCVFFPCKFKIYVVGLFLNMTPQMHIQYSAPSHTAVNPMGREGGVHSFNLISF